MMLMCQQTANMCGVFIFFFVKFLAFYERTLDLKCNKTRAKMNPDIINDCKKTNACVERRQFFLTCKMCVKGFFFKLNSVLLAFWFRNTLVIILSWIMSSVNSSGLFSLFQPEWKIDSHLCGFLQLICLLSVVGITYFFLSSTPQMVLCFLIVSSFAIHFFLSLHVRFSFFAIVARKFVFFSGFIFLHIISFVFLRLYFLNLCLFKALHFVLFACSVFSISPLKYMYNVVLYLVQSHSLRCQQRRRLRRQRWWWWWGRFYSSVLLRFYMRSNLKRVKYVHNENVIEK